MSTRTAKLSEKKAETSIVLIVFDGVLCEVRAYNCYCFLLLLKMNQVPEKLYLGQCTKIYPVNAI